MINITIMCVGKIKEKSLISLCDEYIKRLSKYSKTSVIEFQDEKFGKNLSINEINRVKNIECDKIIEKINSMNNPYVISLDLNSNTYDSIEFSKKISNIATCFSSNIVFIIGGSLGISDKLLKISNEKISFSTMTFPHQLIRVFLLEQLFRAFKIQNNEIYHH